MATTAGGTPYVESSDLVADYPTVSLALAEHIDTIGGGKILQIVRNSNASNFTTTSTTFVDMTGMDVTITPQKSTSVIYIIVTASAGVTRTGGGAARGQAQIVDSSNNPISGAEDHTYGIADGLNHNLVLTMISATIPGITTPVTYKVRHKAQTGCTSLFLNSNSTAQIIALEYDAA